MTDDNGGDNELDEIDSIEQKNKKKKEPKEQIIQTSKIIKDGQLWEQIYDPNTKQSKYITWDEKHNQPVYMDYFVIDGRKYFPIKDDLLEKGAVILPTGILDYVTVEQLDNDTTTHIYKYLDVTDEHRQKATWYARLTWVIDNLNTIPYMRALGDYGSGKTRYEDVIGGICYKPMYVGGSVRAAPIYRVIDLWRGTAIFDEFTLTKSDETTDIIQILNNGYQRGKPVLRCKDGNYSQVECFDPFGSKILATRKQFEDSALESRCITEVIQETVRPDIPIDLGKTFFSERQELQNKLLFFRLKNWDKIIPDEKLCIDFGMIQPRIKQTFLPFTVLFQYDKLILDQFIETVKQHNTKMIEENSVSYNGLIVNIYLNFLEKDMPCITAQDIRNELVNKHGFNEKKTYAGTIGKMVKPLGFISAPQKILGETKRVLTIKNDRIKRLVYRYVNVDEQEKMLALCERKSKQTELTFSADGGE